MSKLSLNFDEDFFFEEKACLSLDRKILDFGKILLFVLLVISQHPLDKWFKKTHSELEAKIFFLDKTVDRLVEGPGQKLQRYNKCRNRFHSYNIQENTMFTTNR